MSTLTKVFVILLVVFTIAFSTMTVSVVSQTTHWKNAVVAFENEARIIGTNYRSLMASNAAETATLRDTIRAQQELAGSLQQKLGEAQNQIGELKSNLAQASSEKSSAEASIRAMVSQLQVAQSMSNEYRTQRDALESRGIELERRNIDLNERVNELTAQLAVLVEQRRQFEQQIHTLQRENERIASALRDPSAARVMESASGLALEGISAESPVARSAVRGRVLDVSGNMVTISVGSADGVEKGMVFVIHRGGDYVGDLKISVVDPDQSAGVMVRSETPPRESDEVTDAAWLSSRRG